MAEQYKVCTKCGVEKPLTGEYFHQSKVIKSGFRSICIICRGSHSKRAKVARDNKSLLSQGLRRCMHCKVIKPLTNENFYRGNKNPIKFKSKCKDCFRQISISRKSKKEDRILYEQGLKRCTACLEIKPATIEYFYKRDKHWSKLQNYCKICTNSTYSDKYKEYRQQYRIDNKSTLIIQKHNYRARKRNLPDTLTTEQVQSMLEYFNHSCAICGQPFDMFTKVEFDHWIPISSPDCTGTIATNIIPLCGNRHGFKGYTGCNQSKSNRDAETWLIEKFNKRKANNILKRINDYFESVK